MKRKHKLCVNIKHFKSTGKIDLFRLIIYFLIMPFFLLEGCKKLVDIKGPVTSINEENVYSTDATAISVLTGIYTSISFNTKSFTGNASISVFGGLSSDELTLFNGVTKENYIAYYKNDLQSNVSQNFGTEHWSPIYTLIFTCNSVIEGLSKSNTLTAEVKQQLLGEAKFMRAFFYFYLTSMYGDVPLVLSTDYSVNARLDRSAKDQVYEQIITDLLEAQQSLNENFLDPSLLKSSTDRVRPTKWAATALLARVYLYSNDWSNAEKQATLIINNTAFNLNTLDNAFQRSSLGNKESIWQLQPVRTGWNTEDGRIFNLPVTGPSDPNGFDGYPVYLSTILLSSFEPNDERKSKWIKSVTVGANTYYFPYKYKVGSLNSPVTEHLTILRLAEQYLIRAEARAQMDNILGAKSDLNQIRLRAQLPETTASDKNSLLTVILHERQVELFVEFSHRWFDLKRAGVIDVVMSDVSPKKGGLAWRSYQQLYPILFADIQRNNNLIQNTGY